MLVYLLITYNVVYVLYIARIQSCCLQREECAAGAFQGSLCMGLEGQCDVK